jgi:hypothetical protein
MEVFYVFSGPDLNTIRYSSGSIGGAKHFIEVLIHVERYDEAEDVYAIVAGQRMFRIERRELR